MLTIKAKMPSASLAEIKQHVVAVATDCGVTNKG